MDEIDVYGAIFGNKKPDKSGINISSERLMSVSYDNCINVTDDVILLDVSSYNKDGENILYRFEPSGFYADYVIDKTTVCVNGKNKSRRRYLPVEDIKTILQLIKNLGFDLIGNDEMARAYPGLVDSLEKPIDGVGYSLTEQIVY